VKDDACTVRDIEVCGEHIDVAGFVRVLDSYEDGAGALHLLVLTDADPIVWRLRFEVVRVGGVRVCLLGVMSFVGWSPCVVFMHPPTRAGDELWKPHQADMTLVNPERK
jgi:hypothetical protein